MNVPVDEAGLADTKDRCLKANPELTSDDVSGDPICILVNVY
jgi:hypothetical protein